MIPPHEFTVSYTVWQTRSGWWLRNNATNISWPLTQKEAAKLYKESLKEQKS